MISAFVKVFVHPRPLSILFKGYSPFAFKRVSFGICPGIYLTFCNFFPLGILPNRDCGGGIFVSTYDVKSLSDRIFNTRQLTKCTLDREDRMSLTVL